MERNINKNQLRTVRFAPNEGDLVNAYLKKNPLFESFSALARVATLSFIGQQGTIHLNPLTVESKKKRPSFLWDYDLSEVEVRETLNQAGFSPQKIWLIERILGQARFVEIFEYLDLETIQQALPRLRLAPKIKKRWEYAVNYWTSHE